MHTSDPANIHQRILSVMAKLRYIQKGEKTVNNQYKFVSHDAVSAATHPLFVECGIVMVPSVKFWEQSGNRTSVLMSVRFVNSDNPADYVEIDALGFGIDSQDKGPGKAVSYATKYAVLKILMLETGDDPERDNIEHVGADAERMAKDAREALEKGDWPALCALNRDEFYKEANKLLTSGERRGIKDLVSIRNQYRDSMNLAAASQDDTAALQLSGELTSDEKRAVWRVLSKETQTYFSSLREIA